MSWDVVAQWIAALAAAATLVWSHLTLRTSIRGLSTTIEESRYSQLDTTYLELLRTRVEHPVLAGPRPEGPHDVQIALDNYACMIWNFIESVLDYCDRPGRNFSAWAPAVEYESGVYASWLSGENLNRYDPEFKGRVEKMVLSVAAHREAVASQMRHDLI
ncbi:MAG: hypothetical protein ABL878_17670 [Burkholderiales bacterium]